MVTLHRFLLYAVGVGFLVVGFFNFTLPETPNSNYPVITRIIKESERLPTFASTQGSKAGGILPQHSSSDPPIDICPRWDNQLAIVRPFFKYQEMIRFLGRFTNPNFYPCLPGVPYDTDLFYYYHGIKEDVQESEILSLMGSSKECFRTIGFLYSGVTAKDDDRLKGASEHWHGLFPLLKAQPIAYDYFFIMESDVFPIRNNWLRKLKIETGCGEDFYVKGSQWYREEWSSFATLGWHINGNALYNFRDTYFRDHIIPTARENGRTKVYDVDTWRWFYPKLRTDLTPRRELVHKYKLSNFIVNWGNVTWKVSEWRNKDPNIYFIHGVAIDDDL